MTDNPEVDKAITDICALYKQAPEAVQNQLAERIGKSDTSKITLECVAREFSEVVKKHGEITDQFLHNTMPKMLGIMNDESLPIDVKLKAGNAVACMANILIPNSPAPDSSCKADIVSTLSLIHQREKSAAQQR